MGKSRKNVPHQGLQRNCSGSAPCRICCLSWSTAFSSHTKGFTHLKQSWRLQCECYLTGVRFGLQNWRSFIRRFYRQIASAPILKPWISTHFTRDTAPFLVSFKHEWYRSPVIDMQAQKKWISCNLACVATSLLLMLRNWAPSAPFIAPMTCTSQIFVYGCLEMARDSKYFRWKMIEESKNCFQSSLAYQVVSPFQTFLQKGLLREC